MAVVSVSDLVDRPRPPAADELSDWQLLERFAGAADEAAFAALVRRHGPLVLGVCRRVLGTGPDLDDAFQATFVILSRKAATIRKQTAVASWLHSVAHRLSLRLRAQIARRQRRESPLQRLAETHAMHADSTAPAGLRELGLILDEELEHLPGPCRDALVLCQLEGLSHADAARRLGWALGTLKGRLLRGRNLLRQRLQRRGVALSAMALTVALHDQASAVVPGALSRAAARCAAPAHVPARAAALADLGLRALAAGRLKLVLAAALAVGLLGAAGAWLAPAADPAPQAPPAAAAPAAELPPVPAAQQPPAEDRAEQLAEDEQKFRATLKIDGKVLLDFFRDHTLSAADRSRIGQLIVQLKSAAYKEREQATASLIAEGARALPLLHAAQAGATLEQRLRLERCLKGIGKPDWGDTQAAAARLVRDRRPAAGCEVLLAFVPFALPDAMDDVLDALCHLGVKDGKVDARLTAALADPDPAKRAAAAVVVGGHGFAVQRDQVRRLLDDADPGVRLRAAQGLLAAGLAQAVPPLLAVLAGSDLSLAERAEGLLAALAGETAPTTALGTSPQERKACQEAWSAWWKQQGEQLKPDQRIALFFTDGPRAAKKVAAEFIDAIFTGNRAVVSRICALPFTIPGEPAIKTREELLAEFGDPAPPKKDTRVTIGRVLTVSEQLKLATRPEEREYLASLPRAGTYAVRVEVFEPGGQADAVVLVIRVQAGRARVAGLLEPAGPPDRDGR
jgi:RNA polymerase sigma factor (sigma-70 family)